MSTNRTPASLKPLRLWPGVVAVTLGVLVWFLVPVLAPGSAVFGMFGSVACGLVALLWWLFFSRAPWIERLGALALMALAMFAVRSAVHISILGAGMGMLLPIFSIPVMSLALVASLVVSQRLSAGFRRPLLAVGIVLGAAAFTLIRTGGISGDANSDFHWRWTKTPEERLLAMAANEKESVDSAPRGSAVPLPTPAPTVAPSPTSPPNVTAPASATKTPEENGAAPDSTSGPEWSGFRGPARDNVVRGVRIETDWSRSKPVELWRRPIGPGWGSFAVHGDFMFTQEQRGDDEIVSCYRLSTGAPVWKHRDPVRFYESNGGAGPRGTPTVSNGRVYTFGATGILNALDARDGSVVWSRNASSDTKKKIPEWGFASSPLVVGDTVIVATAGVLAGYDAATGQPRWSGPAGGGGYSSPQLSTIDGVAQVLLLNGAGVTSVSPGDGALLWKHEWKGDGIVQPAVISGGDVLLGSGSGLNPEVGLRRISVAHRAGGWSAEERWTTTGLKPYYNDFVVHKGYAFGFDGSILSCVDLADGQRKWKGGRYGHGQLIVLPDQDVLLVLTEEGEIALVSATADQFTELARLPALEGKTWNHPVIVGDMLLVRNGQEMAAFRLAPAPR